LKYIKKIISVNSLVLDPENPRFKYLRTLHDMKDPSQDDLSQIIEAEDATITLRKSIMKSGVIEPIYVKEMDNGKYLVIEGNRRAHILKQLCKENVKPPKDVRYDEVMTNVISPETPETDIKILKITLSTHGVGGAFIVASNIYGLWKEDKLEIDDIALASGTSRHNIRKRIENYEYFLRYIEYTGDKNHKKLSFFTEAPKIVKDWIKESDKNQKTYFGLITPNSEGIQKIRSVVTKGGLRDFAKILKKAKKEPNILEKFLKDPNITVGKTLEKIDSD